jgi:hypothetical protein
MAGTRVGVEALVPKLPSSPSRMLERASTPRTVAPCLFTVLFGRLHIDASALASGSASHYGWLTSVAGTGECRMIVFDELAMCCWRTRPSMFGTAAASQSCMRVARSGWS